MNDTEAKARLADMLVRCGIERGVLGRIDADNVARILLPVVREIADQRAAEELEAFGRALRRDNPRPDGSVPAVIDDVALRAEARAAALRGEGGR